MRSDLLEVEHERFGEEVADFIDSWVVPRMPAWDSSRRIDRE